MRFWVDIDNAPHVLVLRPIITKLTQLGHTVKITARDYGQTIPLLRMYGMKFRIIGKHWGKNRIKKYLSLLTRSASLFFYAIGKSFDLAICHGARAIFIPSRILRIPLVVISDYEHTNIPSFMLKWASLLLYPDVIPVEVFDHHGLERRKLFGYPGLKEDLYIHGLTPDPSFLGDTGMDYRKVIILMRPPATMAHYSVPESERLFFEIVNYLCSQPEVQILFLPRTGNQDKTLRLYFRRRGFANIFIPERVYEGPRIIQCVDLVISGGGTMNREAATLGVPVYSIYQGTIGAVDRHLICTGRLVHLSSIDMAKKIPLVKKRESILGGSHKAGKKALSFIVDKLVGCAILDAQ
jgi:predicted glycosyltransferase